MKTIGFILIVLGVAGAITMTVLTYSFTASYELLEDSRDRMEQLVEEPQTPENMQEMENLETSIMTYTSVVDRSNWRLFSLYIND